LKAFVSGNPKMPVQVMPCNDAQLLEVFSSIQGEAELVGYRQIFIRLAGCNLHCAYCDTDYSLRKHCRVEDAPGSGQFRGIANPVSLEVIASLVSAWVDASPGMHHSISLTGGEPLLQAPVLLNWAPVLREILPLHLETNGTCAAALEPLVSHLDMISMDVKLSSVTGVATPWKLHRAFLEIASRTKVCVKAVVGEETPVEEMIDLGRMVRQMSPDTSVYLQPVTQQGKIGMSSNHLLCLQAAVAKQHANVRVVPQMHVFMNLL